MSRPRAQPRLRAAPRGSRPRSLDPRDLARRPLPQLTPGDRAALAGRPRTRADCQDGPRPCPWVACRYNLYLHVTEKGWITLNWPGREPEDLPATCALDVADSDGAELNTIARVTNLSRAAVLAIQERAIEKIRERLEQEPAP